MAHREGYGCELYGGGTEGVKVEQIKELLRDLHNYSVVFLKQPHEEASAIGSGTFVTLGSIAGILTCRHVIEVLEPNGMNNIAGHLIGSAAKNNLAFRLHAENILVFPKSDQHAPDLGFIRLNEPEASSLKARFSFLNLEMQAKEFQKPEPDAIETIHILSGAFEELTQKVDLEDGTSEIKLVTHLTDGTILKKEYISDFDYVKFQPKPFEPEQNPLPASFVATSGGGLWRCFIQQNCNNNSFTFSRRFVGVAFYETGGLPNQIICHGPESIYIKLMPKIRELWPNG